MSIRKIVKSKSNDLVIKEHKIKTEHVGNDVKFDTVVAPKNDIVNGIKVEEVKEIAKQYGGQGGGDVPTEYLKTIEKDTTNQRITITDQNDNETSFNYGGSGGGVTPEVLLENMEGSEYISVDLNLDANKVVVELDETNLDDVPTEESTNLVKSGGVYDALSDKQDTLSTAQQNAVDSGITSAKVTDINNNTTARHTHDNKSVLDTVTASVVSNSHTHTNKTTLDGITSDNLVSTTEKSTWNGKQDAINDLSTIRTGAELGATSLQSSDIVDNVISTDTENPLSANQGKILNDRINNLSSIGRFLSLWDCTTGLPLSNPSGTPYAYNTGDYFRINKVATQTGEVNYMPSGSSYTGVASTTVYSGSEIGANDIWFYDGTTWQLQINHAVSAGTIQDVQIEGTSVVSSGVANIQIASSSNFGVIKLNQNYGVGAYGTSGVISTKSATDSEIEAKSNQFKVITPNKIDKAVMEGLGSNSLTWSDTYKANARNTIGAGTSNFSGNYNDLTNKPTIPDELKDLADDSTHRTVSDTEKSTWNGKQDTLTAGSNISIVDNVISATASSPTNMMTTNTQQDVSANKYFEKNIYMYGQYGSRIYFTLGKQSDGPAFQPSPSWAPGGIQMYIPSSSTPKTFCATAGRNIDLGYYNGSTTDCRWNNLYLKGNISDGTNSASVTDIINSASGGGGGGGTQLYKHVCTYGSNTYVIISTDSHNYATGEGLDGVQASYHVLCMYKISDPTSEETRNATYGMLIGPQQ